MHMRTFHLRNQILNTNTRANMLKIATIKFQLYLYRVAKNTSKYKFICGNKLIKNASVNFNSTCFLLVQNRMKIYKFLEKRLN